MSTFVKLVSMAPGVGLVCAANAASAESAAPVEFEAKSEAAPPASTAEQGADGVWFEGRDLSEGLHGKLAGVLAWNFNIPLGSVRNFAANVSPVGLEIQMRYWVLPQLSLGVGGEWVSYVDTRPRARYELENATVTTIAYNQLLTSTLRASADFYFLSRGSVLPYVGPHFGVGWSRYRSRAADLELAENQVSIAYGLEAGAVFPMPPEGPMLVVCVRYTGYPATEFRSLVDSMQTLGISVGIGF